VLLEPGMRAVGSPVAELGLDGLGVEVRTVRRRGAKAGLDPEAAGPLQAGDVVVLLGTPEALSAAEERLVAR
jgi:CPA2 family monovalent cation:H+ antiporter-2